MRCDLDTASPRHRSSCALTSQRPTSEKDSPEVLARIREALALVDIIARQIRKELHLEIPTGDLVSYGSEGLLSAARTFDADRGVPFKRWANLRIRGAVVDGLRRECMLPRGVHRRLAAIEAGDRVQEAVMEEDAMTAPATPEAADARLTSYLAGIATAMAVGFLRTSASGEAGDVPSPDESPEEQVEREQLAKTVRDALATRPDAERRLLERHYFDGVTFDEAARELGLSRSWASRLHARAIEGIGRGLKKT